MTTVAALRARLGGATPLLMGACVAAVLALALPWSGTVDGSYLPGWYVPGTCVTVYDGDGWPSMDCTSGTISPGLSVAGAGASGGRSGVVRVFVAAAVVLTVVAWRRRSARLAEVAVLVAAAGLVLGGLRPRAGQLVYAAGIALLVVALRSGGLLRARAGRRPRGALGVSRPRERRPRSPAEAARATPHPGGAPWAPRP